MVVFGRAVLSDGFDMLKVPARCSRRLLLQNPHFTHNPAQWGSECKRLFSAIITLAAASLLSLESQKENGREKFPAVS
jgi:hypothetical protein